MQYSATSTAALGAAMLLTVGRATAQSADLFVLGVDTSGTSTNGQSLAITGSVAVEVRNFGGTSSGSSCALVVFEDADGDGVYDLGSEPLLGSDTIPALAAGATHVETVAISGSVSFRGNRVHALVDAFNAIAESNEGNNVGHSAGTCSVGAAGGTFAASLKWRWTPAVGDPFPSHFNVLSAPCVCDLDLDGVPEVIFTSTNSTAGGPTIIPGVLRVIRGDTGADVWPAAVSGVSATSGIAVGDVDGDGYPDIVAVDALGTHLVLFDRNGVMQWTSGAVETLGWDTIALVNLDQSGLPEILVRRQALIAAGAVLWTGAGGIGGTSVGGLSIAADVDANGSIDVVAGNTVYSSSGATLYSSGAISDGHCAVANFDTDAQAEIVHVSSGAVRLLQHDLTSIWGPVALPTGGGPMSYGSPPAVADFDGDGAPEIAVAGGARLAVFETGGALRWEATIQDLSSGRTPPTAFDLDGDGAAEVIYRDELRLHVFRGTDGATLFSTPLSSCTWIEMPVVADVDADGDAEILCPANTNCFPTATDYGLYLFEGPNDAWSSTRRVWNQHTYHVTNVDERGRIPSSEPRPWQTPVNAPTNSFRANATRPPGAPNLTPSYLRVSFGPPDIVTARLGNGGDALAQSGLVLEFYDGPPLAGGSLLGSVTTASPLEPGAHLDLGLTLPAGAPPVVYVRADAAGVERECDELDNDYGYARATSYCTAGTTSNGCTPQIAVTANPSVSFATTCVVSITSVEGSRAGIVFYGVDNSGFTPAPWAPGSTSWRCIKPPVQRTPSQNSGGAPNTCSGVLTLDWNAYQTTHPLALGTPWSVGADAFVQAWFRDPPAPSTTNLSDAVRLIYGL